MATPIYRDGDFYINNANQDFYLRESGAWVRKGNIRDEGSTGLVGVAPIIGLGFLMQAPVSRIRYLSPDNFNFGTSQSNTVDRIRLLSAPMNLGMTAASEVDRTRFLLASMGFGFNQAAAIAGYLSLTASMNMGFLTDVELTDLQGVVAIMADMGLGFNQASSIVPLIRLLEAQMALGFSASAAVARVKALAATMALGFSEAATVTATAPATDTGHATATITGEAILNSPLTCVFGNNDPEGSATGITYQWNRAGSAISGATQSVHYCIATDIGKSITCTVSYTDGAGFSDSVTTSGVTVVDGFFALASTSSPYVLWFNAQSQTALSTPATNVTFTPPTMRLSPNKRWLAMNTQFSAGANCIGIYDMKTGAPVYYGKVLLTGSVFDLAWSADSTKFAASQTASPSHVYDLATLTEVETPSSGLSIDFSPDGTRFAVGPSASSPYFIEYDLATWTTAASPAVLPTTICRGIRYSPDGQYVAMICNTTPPTLIVYKRSTMAKCTIAGIALTSFPNSQNGHALAWAGDSSTLFMGAGASFHTLIATRSGDTFTVANATDDAPTTAISGIFNYSTNKLYVGHGPVSSKSISTYNVPAFTLASDGAAQTASPTAPATFEVNA